MPKTWLHKPSRRSPGTQDQLARMESCTTRGEALQRADGALLDISGHTANVHPTELLAPGSNLGNARSAQEVQICFDFTKGRCNRRNCKFSHDIGAIIRYNSREQGICFDFLRGECNRGPLCRFSHDLTKVVSQWMIELQDIPHSRPPPRGICYDFVRGQCPRGRHCRFSHDLLEIAVATSRALPPENNEQHQWGVVAWNTIRHCMRSNDPPSPEHPPDSPDDTESPAAGSGDGSMTPPPQSTLKDAPPSIWHEPSISMWRSLPSLRFRVDSDIEMAKPPKHYLSNVRIRKLLGNDLCSTFGMLHQQAAALTWRPT